MAQLTNDSYGPFEGPEKLLELWFAPSPESVPDASAPVNDGRTGLRKIPRKVWEEMLDIVKCKTLSVIEGADTDAYLLSESSFFVSAHRLILKTCGTTLNLLGLPRILEIAAQYASMPYVYRCFYSRKSFMFPERQLGPHRDWKQEVEYLDKIFKNGAAYTVGKVNGDHWLLYLTNPDEVNESPALRTQSTLSCSPPDCTIEILMSELASSARQPFFSPLSPSDNPHIYADKLSEELGIVHIFPQHLTSLDAYSFSPCGYSANALVRVDTLAEGHSSASDSFATPTCLPPPPREGYYTIHVTPEEGWSYASFECNTLSPAMGGSGIIPDLRTLVQRVVAIFKPGRLSLTLFMSNGHLNTKNEANVEVVQDAFRRALAELSSVQDSSSSWLAERCYRRTDKINYEFGGYDLAFASFELR